MECMKLQCGCVGGDVTMMRSRDQGSGRILVTGRVDDVCGLKHNASFLDFVVLLKSLEASLSTFLSAPSRSSLRAEFVQWRKARLSRPTWTSTT
jgi:hypothetical protein